jgi:hypothetical protein
MVLTKDAEQDTKTKGKKGGHQVLLVPTQCSSQHGH